MAGASRARRTTAAGGLLRAAEDREISKRSPFAGLLARESVPLTEVDHDAAWDSICYALSQGYAVTMSTTADGGALKLTLWIDGKKHVGYGASAETIDELFSAIGPLQGAPSEGKGQ